MQDNYFDEIVRTKLLNLELPFVASDWDALAEQLDAPFDEAVRAKLQDAEVPYVPADWTAMELELMNPFDRAISEKLTAPELEAMVPAAGDWMMLEEALDASFDAEMADKLGNHAVPYVPDDWGVMAGQLDQAFPPTPTANRNLLWFFAILLVVLFSWKKNPVSEQFAAGNLEAIISTETKGQPLTETPGAAQADEISYVDGKQNKDIAPQVVSQERDNDEVSTTSSLAVPSSGNTQKLRGGETLRSVAPSHVVEAEVVDLAELGSTRGESTGIETQIIYGTYPRDKQSIRTCHLIDPRDVSKSNSIAEQRIANQVKLAGRHLLPEPSSGKSEVVGNFRLGLYGAAFSSVSELNELGEMGFASGVRVELPITGQWSLVTGLLYANKKYDRMDFVPNKDQGSVGTTPFNIARFKANFRLLELPILAKYHFQSNGPLSFYFQAGLTPFITLEEDHFEFNPMSASNVSETLRLAIPVTDPRDLRLGTHLYERIEPEYQHASAKTYVGTLQIAPGIEWKLGEKLHLQIEPYLQLGLQRIGAKNQKLHAAGGAMSLMYTFGVK